MNLPFKNQLLIRFVGISIDSVSTSRRNQEMNFGGNGVFTDIQEAYRSQKGISEEIPLRRTPKILPEKVSRIMGGPFRSLRRYISGVSEETHLRHANRFHDLVNQAEIEYPEHLVLTGVSIGADQSITGFINMIYAEALAHQKALASGKIEAPLDKEPSNYDENEISPLLKGLKKLSIIVDDPIVIGVTGDLMSDSKGNRIPLSEKLKFIKEMASESLDIDCTIISSRTSTVREPFTRQWAELRDDPNSDINVIYASFNHTLLTGEHRTRSLLLIDEPSEDLLNYTSDDSLSEDDRIERLKEILLPYLVDVDKVKQLGIDSNLSSEERRKIALRECNFNLNEQEKPDVFRHLVNQKHLQSIITYHKLGYISDDLLKDMVTTLENRDLKVMHEHIDTKDNVSETTHQDPRYQAFVHRKSSLQSRRLIAAKKTSGDNEESLASTYTQTRRQAFGKARFRRKK